MLLAVPNVSEGRDHEWIAAIATAFDSGGGLLDVHSDPVHNRTVLTLHGEPGGLAATLLGGGRAAMDAIDMSEHEGAHPCVGALDVCPVVWLSPGGREAAIAEARLAADLIATELEVPVFLYGELARSAERRERSFFRNGGLEELSRRMAAGELEPDCGPSRLHPTVGATLVTARPPLAAFNVELEGGDLHAAQEVAAALRESRGGLPGVRAIAIPLGEGRAQISTNVHDPVAVPLAHVTAEVQRLAVLHGARVSGTELIGLVPEAAIEGLPPDLMPAGFDPARHLIERRLAAL